MDYPKHLYDQTRITIAEQLMKKELTKLLPDTSITHLSGIFKWSEAEPDIIGFWDAFSATMESLQLASSFTSFITADNYTWTRTSIPVGTLRFSIQLAELRSIPNFTYDPKSTTVKDAVTSARAAGALESMQQHVTYVGEAYPLIVVEKGDDRQIMDGNHRALQAGLLGQDQVDAWLGTQKGDKPKNFWVPINDLLQLVKLFKLASSPEQKQAVRHCLELLFNATAIARISYTKRVAGSVAADEFLDLPLT